MMKLAESASIATPSLTHRGGGGGNISPKSLTPQTHRAEVHEYTDQVHFWGIFAFDIFVNVSITNACCYCVHYRDIME